jgi:hypothetical protein
MGLVIRLVRRAGRLRPEAETVARFRAIMRAMTETVKRRLTTVLRADVQGDIPA